jgi:hypothetical protein
VYASFLGISEALHLDIFRQPLGNRFFDSLDGPYKELVHPLLSFPLDKTLPFSDINVGQGLILYSVSGSESWTRFFLDKNEVSG